MRDQIAAQINNIINILLLIVVVLTPLIFLPVFTEFYDTTKIVVLVAVVLTCLLLWSLYWVLKGKVLITRTPLDIPFLLLGLVIGLSAFFSQTQYVAIFGFLPRVHGGAVSYIAYILLYFIAVSHVKTSAQIKNLLFAILASATIASVLALLAYFGLYLPLTFTKLQGFNPTGSAFSLSAVLVMTLPVLLYSLVRPNKLVAPIPAMLLASLFTLVVFLIGRNGENNLKVLLSPAWLALFASYLLVYLTTKKSQLRNSLPLLLTPFLIGVVVTVITFVPIGGNFNILKQKADTYPQEVQLPFTTSWNVAAGSLIKTPFLGTGPATFGFNFLAFKPAEFNSSRYWNFRFDNAYNEFLNTLSTVGILGLLALIFVAAVVMSFALRGLSDEDNTLAVALAASALIGIVLLLTHVATGVMMVIFVILLALLMAVHKQTSSRVEELSIGIKASKLTDSNLVVGDLLPIMIFIPVFIFVVYGFWSGGSLVLADYNHRMALNSVNTNTVETYNYLVAAENLSPYVDLYRIDLAQTNFAIANAIALSKGPTEASPGGSLTDEDKQRIQALLQQSVREAQVATVLNPRNSANFEVLGGIYRQISGVAENALSFSLNAYGRALALDPLNPVLRLNIGGIYYSVKNYDLAIRFFQDAINLKPDYANAYYNLSIALRDKGDLTNAQGVAEQLVSLLSRDTNNPDYKLASEYLTDLKARIATGSANQSAITAPAGDAETIDPATIPSEIDLGSPPNEATPEPVKR